MLTSFISLIIYITPTILFGDGVPCFLCFIQRNIFLALFFTCFFQYYVSNLRFISYALSIFGIATSFTHLAIIGEYIKTPKFCKIIELPFGELSNCVDISQKTLILVSLSILIHSFIIFGCYKEY